MTDNIYSEDYAGGSTPLGDVIITETLAGLGTEPYRGYLAHALCLEGKCTFRFNTQPYTLEPGDLMIVRKGSLIENLEAGADFKVINMYVSPAFVEQATPQTNYGMRGALALFLNPIMHLNKEQQFVCERDFRWVSYRLEQTGHKFFHELLLNAVQAAILDYFDFHATLYKQESVSTQNALLINGFLSMLDEGTYRQHREVSYYADKLCVTPKYLSEVSKRVSGYPANFWINRYTALDIARLLRDRSLTFVQIADMFGFSSPAYFSRYVQRMLGVNPTRYRE